MKEIKVNLDNLTNEERETLLKLVEKGNKTNKKRERLGNYFKTEEEAEFARKKHLIYQKLKDYALEHNTEDIDWENYLQIKYFIYCNTKSNDLCIMDVSEMKIAGQVYFTSEKIAENAIKYIGEDRIEKYLFGVNE